MARGQPRKDDKAAELLGGTTAWRRKKEKKKAPPKVKPAGSWPETSLPESAANWHRLFETHLQGYRPRATEAEVRFESGRALKACRFFHEKLKHVKGEKAGSPFFLEPWQQAVIGCLFGWKKRVDGEWRRRYSEALLYIPRKNGKTALAAGVVLFGLFMDGEPVAEVYGAASEYKQASLVFEHARGMVLQCPELKDRCQIYSGQAKAIQLQSDYSTYRVIASDAGAAHGFNTHLAVVDELHTLPDRHLVDALSTSTGARRNPLLLYITTADFDRESICNEKLKYAKKVRDGEHDDPAFLPVIFEASRDDDWKDPDVWEAVNPNLGVSFKRSFIERECKRAQEVPSFSNTFLRLHLNVQTEQDTRWLPMDVWDAGGEGFEIGDLDGCDCYGGLDLASTQDTTALVLVFPGEDESYYVLPFFWIPREGAHLRFKRDKVDYPSWHRQGLLSYTEGNVTDYGWVRKEINELADRYRIREIAYDPWNARHLVQQLQDDDGLPMIEFRQGYITMNPASKEFERLLMDGKIHHGGHPILRWQASNVAIKTDPAGNIKPDKAKSSDRIDGIVALIMGVARAALQNYKPSPYEGRGLHVI